MSTETTKKKIKIDNGTEFARVYTDKEVDSKLTNKQDTLVSGTNIKTLNGQSILGSGDLPISGGSSYTPLEINVSSTDNPIDLTKEQYDILFNAISNNEPIIAYIVIRRDTIFVKIPLTSPMHDGQVENVKLFYGAYFSVSVMDNKYYTYLWYLAKISEEQDVSYVLQCSSSLSLLESNGGLLFSSDKKKLQFSLSSQEKDFIGSAVTFDSINGNPVIHSEFTTSRNYDLGKTINLFGNHSILVPNASSDTAINLYNHFIKITGTADSDKKIVIRFTIQSSKDTAINTIENLSTLLGNEFELGCSGIYSTYNITGLKKNADISLSIIYNNNGAESLLSSTGLTLTISDTVKTI